MELKHVLLATSMIVASTMGVKAQIAYDPIDDPLHLCYNAPGNCTGFNGVTIADPSVPNPLQGFGVSSSPAPQSGTLFFAVLRPDNESQNAITIDGALNGSALSFGAFIDKGTFTAGQFLTDLLGSPFVGSVPPNPFSAYSAATTALDPGFNHYNVELVQITNPFITGNQAGQTNIMNNSFDLGGDVEPGTIVTAFLCTDGCITTAQSSSLVFTGTSAVPEIPTWAMMFAGFSLLGFAAFRQRKSQHLA